MSSPSYVKSLLIWINLILVRFTPHFLTIKDWIAISSIYSDFNFVDDFASKSSHPFFFLIRTSALIKVSKYINAPSKITFILSELIASSVSLTLLLSKGPVKSLNFP